MEVWFTNGLLSPDDIKGKDVLDWEGSWGQFALKMLELGANHVTVSDTFLSTSFYEEHMQSLESLSFIDAPIESDLLDPSLSGKKYDLIFSHTVSEHIPNLATSLSRCYELLKPGGLFFLVHDNYYHPSGAHDNTILSHVGNGKIGYPGPKCWESRDKCLVSEDFRAKMLKDCCSCWWGADELLTPENCNDCLFFKRTKPWAHLLNQAEFNQVFIGEGHKTGLEHSLLNKITPFQLRQFIAEAGFDVERWHRVYVDMADDIPTELLEEQFYLSRKDLITMNIIVRCRLRGEGSKTVFTPSFSHKIGLLYKLLFFK